MENSAVTEWRLVCTEQYKVQGGGRGGFKLITTLSETGRFEQQPVLHRFDDGQCGDGRIG